MNFDRFKFHSRTPIASDVGSRMRKCFFRDRERKTVTWQQRQKTHMGEKHYTTMCASQQTVSRAICKTTFLPCACCVFKETWTYAQNGSSVVSAPRSTFSAWLNIPSTVIGPSQETLNAINILIKSSHCWKKASVFFNNPIQPGAIIVLLQERLKNLNIKLLIIA